MIQRHGARFAGIAGAAPSGEATLSSPQAEETRLDAKGQYDARLARYSAALRTRLDTALERLDGMIESVGQEKAADPSPGKWSWPKTKSDWQARQSERQALLDELLQGRKTVHDIRAGVDHLAQPLLETVAISQLRADDPALARARDRQYEAELRQRYAAQQARREQSRGQGRGRSRGR